MIDRAPTLALLTVVTSACAVGMGGSGRAACGPTPGPATLAEAVDSLGLVERLAGRKLLAPGQEGLWVVRRDSAGPLVWPLAGVALDDDVATDEVEKAVIPPSSELLQAVRIRDAAPPDANRPHPLGYFRLRAQRDPAGTVHLAKGVANTCRPELQNADELVELMRGAVQQRKRGGTVVVALFIDEAGLVTRAEVSTSSGDAVLDAMALAIGHAAEFEPARVEMRPVRVRVNFPIVFRKP